MKRLLQILFIATCALAISAFPLTAAQHGDSDHSGHDHSEAGHAEEAHSDTGQGAAGHSGEGHVMDHSGHAGDLIHETTVDGYKLAYHLIDVREKMEGMKGMEGMKPMTHHMMVYIKDPQGNPVSDGMVGYLIENPDDTRQKVMCMAMSGGYGGDVNFDEPGTYTVKAKAMAGGNKLIDSFEYTVE